jgi:hypothetical protein
VALHHHASTTVPCCVTALHFYLFFRKCNFHKFCFYLWILAIHYAGLKSVFAFLDNGEEYSELLRHVIKRWLTLHPAIVRLGQNWPCVKSYFLSLGENDCPKFLWEYLKNCEDGDKEGEQSCILPPYFSYFSNALLCFQSPIKTPEKDTTTVTQLFYIMSTLKVKLEQRNRGICLRNNRGISYENQFNQWTMEYGISCNKLYSNVLQNKEILRAVRSYAKYSFKNSTDKQ